VGKTYRLEDYRGRSLVLVFYLGGDCEHCLRQLRALGKETAAIEALGGQILAVSGDTPERNRALLADKEDAELSLTLLSDPGREAARRYGAWDDFDGLPLHATFLIDRQGNVRWQRISAQPFMDMAFLKEELERVNRLGTQAEARGSIQERG
jgi:peroxiredoxin